MCLLYLIHMNVSDVPLAINKISQKYNQFGHKLLTLEPLEYRRQKQMKC